MPWGAEGPDFHLTLGILALHHLGVSDGLRALTLACPVPSSGCPAQGPAHSGCSRRQEHECLPLKGFRAVGARLSLGNLAQKAREVKGKGKARQAAPHSRPAHQTGLEKKVKRRKSTYVGACWEPCASRGSNQPHKASPPLPPPPCTLVPKFCEGLSSGQQDGVFTRAGRAASETDLASPGLG